jgi:hypothetical protein
MSLWYAVIRDGSVLHFGQDASVATHHFSAHDGSALFRVQSLCELNDLVKASKPAAPQPEVSAQSCCGGSCGTGKTDEEEIQEALDDLRAGFLQGVQVVRDAGLSVLNKLGVSEEDVNTFSGKVRDGAVEVGNNIKAGGEQAVERTKDLGKVVGGWFTKLGEKLSK